MAGNQKLDDFGEKIGGARKDVFRRKFSVEAFDQLNAIERESLITRNSIWPTPDWKALHEEQRAPARLLFWVKSLRDSIAASPNRSAGHEDSDDAQTTAAQKVYAKLVCEVRDRCMEAIAGGEELEQLAVSVQSIYRSICEEAGDPKFGRIIDHDYRAFRRLKGIARANTFAELLEKTIPLSKDDPDFERKNRRREFFVESMEREIARTGFPNTADRAIEKRSRNLGFYIRSVEDSDKFYVWTEYATIAPEEAKKEFADRQFDTHEEAQAAILEFIREALAQQKKSADADVWRVRPQLKNVRREGLPDHRKGANATPEMFMETFGFRGGEFGNWLNQEDRQQSFNHAFDALMDLAQAVGIPPRSLSLGGTLAIAFGARGHGGRAVAHYEPARQVMNLTKMNGAGSLAHEWAHALDNFLADKLSYQGKHSNAFLTDLINEKRFHSRYFFDLPNDEAERLRSICNGMDSFFTNLKSAPAKVEDIQAKAHQGVERMVRQLHQWAGDSQNLFSPELNPLHHKIPESVVHRWNELVTKMVDPQSDFDHRNHLREMDGILKNVAKAILPELKQMAEKDEGLKMRVFFCERMARSGLGSSKRDGIQNNRMFLCRYHHEYVSAEAIAQTSRVKSEFLKDAIEKDKSRATAYYSMPVELFARAFEFCVQQRIEAVNGRRSQYLVHGADRPPVYPGGEDAKRIIESFGKHLLPAVSLMLGEGETLSENAIETTQRTVDAIKQEIRERMKEIPPSQWAKDERIRELSKEVKMMAEPTQGIAA
jgi:hypothetical protein